MDSNTDAIESMAEMGEILGGDYLFDIQYVRRAYGDLRGQFQRSLAEFSALTDGRYAELEEVFGRIDRDIRRVADDEEALESPLVIPLHGLTEGQARSAGGKMANLAVVRRSCSLPVPDGFVITMEGYAAYLRHNRIFERCPLPAEGRAADREWYAGVAKAIRDGETPDDLARAVADELGALLRRRGKDCFLAVRSSAAEEDGERSFAGQYLTLLNVPPEPAAVEHAYRQVIASTFSERAAAYQQRFGYDPGTVTMAVGVLEMVDAAVGGVLYTADPSGRSDRMVIHASWGLGGTVVDGTVDVDRFVVAADGTVVERRIGEKRRMSVRRDGGGVEEVPVQDGQRSLPSLSDQQIGELVRAGRVLANHFRAPQDVEWAIDRSGRLVVLQSRPLAMPSPADEPLPDLRERMTGTRITFCRTGTVVQRGQASGTVHIAQTARELADVPRGAVLVVRHDVPDIVRAMPSVSAILTDTGSLASHMASLAREFRVPTVVNTGDATQVLRQGQAVTLILDDEPEIYDGAAPVPFGRARARPAVDDLYEFRRKRYLLRFIAPLHLVDPFRDDFSPAGCRTLHDILRFIHERSVGRLIEAAAFGSRSAGAVRLELPVPAGIRVIDIGEGLARNREGRTVRPEQIASEPFRALIGGMLEPGLWRSEAVSLSMRDLMSGMLQAPDPLASGGGQVGTNVAVVSREYLNLNIKFGYHFTIVDSFVSDTPRSNHIYFRFAGGAADLAKKSRRLQVIAQVFEKQGYALRTKGDTLVARISGLPRDEMLTLLRHTGRIIAYTRQLDAQLDTDRDVSFHAGKLGQGPEASPRNGEDVRP